MLCRKGCGACCIAPSISSPIPGMPEGKPAGVRCIQLDEHNFCQLFGLALRPAACVAFQADLETCGASEQYAMQQLNILEQLSRPDDMAVHLPV